MTPPVDRAVEIVGTQALLAAALGVSKSAVGQWKEAGRRVPAEHCPVIERLTAGAVRCEELRPDIEWSVLRGEIAPPTEVSHG
ncbi:transcriptional regulator [Paracidovorax konjaci]|uniref:transcriptional regulator n=1 Tax=Paracidovorax konjaci TaxID=32040 RepID=UPI000B88E30B|nr:helix-turn-helix domain-containing protein [Paracidovorax konjaci]